MLWVIKKFSWPILLSATFLGVIALPSDWMEIANSLRAWSEILTVTNREIILVSLCVLACSRLFYMDLRRALNDKDWPPVRYKLIYGLGSVFARDRRIAVLKFLGENADVKALITSLQAKIFLDSFDWSPIEMPEPRRLTKHFADDPFMQSAIDGNAITSFRHYTEREMAMLDHEIQTKINSLRVPANFTRSVIDSEVKRYIERKADSSEYRRLCSEITKEYGAFHPAYIMMKFKVDAVNQIVPAIKDRMESLETSWRNVSLSPKTLHQLLADIETETQL